MNAGPDPYAAGVIALALAFHRTPVQHAELRHGRMPLPAGVIALLKLAGGSEPDPRSATLAPAEELRAAARFFIEQVLFRHGGSHYRVLGLEPGASIEQIKEHHRLLMRMFHPDRARHADDWKGAFATRINLAYSTLHDPETRHRYDATLPPPRQHRAPSPRRRRTAVLGVPAAPSKRGLPPLVRRHLPQWVLAGTALLALAIVGAVYIGNPRSPGVQPAPAHATGTGYPDAAAVAPDAAAIAEAAISEPDAALETAALEAAPLESATPESAPPAPLEAAPVAAPLEAAPVAAPLEAAPVAAPLEAARPAAVLQPLRVAAPQQRPPQILPSESRLVRPPAPPQQMPVRAALPEAPAAGTAPPEPPAAVRPPPLDPNATLARFMSAYERGDTAAFMALFDDVAVGASGGKPQIHREHELLFQTTDLRHIAIDGMTWAKGGDWMRGEGRYRATRMRKGEQRLQTETGTIRIQLLQRGNQAVIMGLDYQPGGRS